jgi:hypothetical protein
LWAPAPTPSGFVGFSVILDGNGAPIWYKRTDSVVIDMKLRSDGRLIYTPQLGRVRRRLDGVPHQPVGHAGGQHLTVARQEPVLRLRRLDNGGRAMVAYPLKTGVDMSAIPGYFNDNGWSTA